MKLCKDCKWFYPSDNKIPGMDNCKSPNIPRRVDYVNGREMVAYCDIERASFSSCGTDAKFFESINQSESEVKSKSFWQRLFNF